MKIIFHTLFFLSLSTIAFSQTSNFDQLIINRSISCADISLNATTILKKYESQNQKDSVIAFLDYWTGHCGNYAESIYRLRLLYNIKYKIKDTTFDTKQGAFSNFQKLINYKYRYSMFYDHYGPVRSLPGTRSTNLKVDTFSKQLAGRISTENKSLNEQAILSFYALDTVSFNLFEEKKYSETPLAKEYQRRKRIIKAKPGMRFSFFGEMYTPSNKLKFIGNQGTFGMSFGVFANRHYLDGTLGITLGKAQNEYTTLHLDSLVSTNHFTRMYVGAEYSYALIEKKHSSISPIIGLYYEQITTVKFDSENDIDGSTIKGYSFNTGIGYRYKFLNQCFVAIQGRYNIGNYKTKIGETNLSGNFFTIRLLLGSLTAAPNNYLD